VDRSLALLERLGICGTFFVLGWVARQRPDLVRRIAAAGHELGSHGWDHTRADTLGPVRTATQAGEAAALIQDISGFAVRAYRAPCWSLPGEPAYYGALAERGFTLSSSTFNPRRWGSVHGVQELPALGGSFGNLAVPLGGTLMLRCLPPTWTAAAADQTRRKGRPAVYWFHPWELVPEAPLVPGGRLFRWARYARLRRLPERLARLLGPGAETLSQAAHRLEGLARVR